MKPSAPSASGDSGEVGFTLLEALVAIALTALLLSFLGGGLRFSLKVWEASDRIDEAAQLVVGRDFLARTLKAAEPMRIRGADGKLRLLFSGRSDRLDFVAAMPERHVKAGLYRVSLYLTPSEPSDSGEKLYDLKIALAPLRLPQADAEDQRHETTLLTAIAGWRISYFDAVGGNGERQWRADWRQRDRLPELVRIEVELDGASTTSWRPLVLNTPLD